MVRLQAGRGACATVLTKCIRAHQTVPTAGHRSDIVLLDEEDKNYTFYFCKDNDSGNEEAQILRAPCRLVKIVEEGDATLLFDKDEEPCIPWRKSEAKKLLFKDIQNGLVPLESKRKDNTNTMTLKDMHSMRPECAECNCKNFSA